MASDSLPRLTFVTGGARSGKSRYAETLIESQPSPWGYIATAQAFDAEMTERIAHHRARRDTRWRTVEAPLELGDAIGHVAPGVPVLVDCLTLWLSNVMIAELDVAAETVRLLTALKTARGPLVVVSNEVGLGIVPDNALARRFRDEQGRLNMAVAAAADRAVLMASGLPLVLKEPKPRA